MAEGAVGATFKVTRVLQAACMIAIIGMTSNFVSVFNNANISPPAVLIRTLAIVCVAVLYCVITFILYLDRSLPFLVATIVDCVFLIALIVVSVVVGKPLSTLNCTVMDKLSPLSSSASSFTSLVNSVTDGGQIHYADWLGTSKSTCLEMKSIWGLSIALCILFTLSATTTIFLWKRARQTIAPTKGEA